MPQTARVAVNTELEDMQTELAKLRAENARLLAEGPRRLLGLKVSEKGALSLYGLGRFPVTLYKSQWLKLLNNVNNIQSFITDHGAELKEKE